ncbi:TLC domain-containing protein 3A isoform X1 [Melospiza georgiana]|uniref:TLC domain-containing protein 3A isoform X1 n=1 Tax=Melospiza georgiana TaxID=44398 RepID=UPI0025ABD2A2|nr:TLC domain-containing protein 3A isoform X1 [Melospiza georgiana]
MATVSGITVMLSCKNVVHDRHWLAVEYVWVLVPYMTYDIYVMYLCHWHKSQEKGILEKKHSLASVWSFLLQERLMVTHHLFILIVLTPITQVRAAAGVQDPLDVLGVCRAPCSALPFFTALQGRAGGLLCGLHLHSRAEHAFCFTGQDPHAAQNAGHAPAQGERDHRPGDLLLVPHPPVPVHVRGVRPPGGDPGVPGAVPHPPALQHRQRVPHRPPALLVHAHLPQGRPALPQLCRAPEQITELITAGLARGSAPQGAAARLEAPPGSTAGAGRAVLASSCRGGASRPGSSDIPAGMRLCGPRVTREGFVPAPPPGADTGHRRGDAGAGPAPHTGSLCRSCRGPRQAWSCSTALQSPSRPLLTSALHYSPVPTAHLHLTCSCCCWGQAPLNPPGAFGCFSLQTRDGPGAPLCSQQGRSSFQDRRDRRMVLLSQGSMGTGTHLVSPPTHRALCRAPPWQGVQFPLT